LVALKRALRVADGFTLYVARANTAVLRRQITADLHADLSRPLVEVTLVLGEPPYEQIARIAQGVPTDAIISVDGLDVLAPSSGPDWFLQQLNWRRAAYRKLARPLLLWVPEYLLRLMMEHAPDFFDWHSGFYEFTTPEATRLVTTRQAYAVGDAEEADLGFTEKRQRIATLRGLLDEYVGDAPRIRRARVKLLDKLGLLNWSQGKMEWAIGYYEQAVQIAQEVGDRRGEEETLGNLGNAYRDLGEMERAIGYYERALQIARQIDDRHGEGKHLGNLGNVYRDLGKLAQAVDHYKRALQIARHVSDRRMEGKHLGNLGLVYRNLGDVEQAIQCYEQALKIAREVGDRRREGHRLGHLGHVYRDLGEMARAIERYEQALQIARELGDRRREGIWLGSLGNAAHALGEMRRAIERYEQALAIAQETGDRRNESFWLGSLGDAYRDLGQAAQAVEYYERGLATARQIGDRRLEAIWAWNIGVLHERTEPTHAVNLMQIRVAYEREIGHPDAEAHAAHLDEVRARPRAAEGQS
jgi:tetratricopeptide (TPR) repeat protein